MAQNLHITIADAVYEDIIYLMEKENKTNKSEYVEEIIRLGLQKKRGVDNGLQEVSGIRPKDVVPGSDP